MQGTEMASFDLSWSVCRDEKFPNVSFMLTELPKIGVLRLRQEFSPETFCISNGASLPPRLFTPHTRRHWSGLSHQSSKALSNPRRQCGQKEDSNRE